MMRTMYVEEHAYTRLCPCASRETGLFGSRDMSVVRAKLLGCFVFVFIRCHALNLMRQ